MLDTAFDAHFFILPHIYCKDKVCFQREDEEKKTGDGGKEEKRVLGRREREREREREQFL